MNFLKSVIKANFFSDKFQGENIFIMGGAQEPYKEQNSIIYPITYLNQYCLANGAKQCVKGMMFYENILGIENADYCGSFDGLEHSYMECSFDRVIVLSGLEMENNPLVAIKQLYRILDIGGRLDLFLCSKTYIFVKHYLSEYEHKWRFSIEDIKNIFNRDKVLRTAQDEDSDFFVVEIEKNNKVDYWLDDIPLYSCRVENYISPQYLPLLGYFHGYKILDEIGSRERTDKNRYEHNYLDKYEFFLHPWRNREFNLLELGIFKGGSARMWEHYFKKANIYCVDVDPNCVVFATKRIKPIIMDLGIEENLYKLRAIQPEIIIDDASHFWDHQIMALFDLFNILPSGGIYIVEDLETSVNQSLFPHYDNGCPIDTYTVLERIIKVTVSKEPEKIDELSPVINMIGRKTEMISMIKGSCIIIKR